MILDFIRKQWVLIAFVLLILILLRTCSSNNTEEREDKTSNNQTNNTDVVVRGVNSLEYNKTILESYPFNINFSAASRRATDTEYFLQGKSPDGHLEATIRFDPRDNQFFEMQLLLNEIPLHPSKSDIQVLIDFANRFNTDYSQYFDRNMAGIFVDEEKFVDDNRWCLNSSREYAVGMDGDIAMNNMDIQRRPEMRTQIIESGNYESITVVNLLKPSTIVELINSEMKDKK